MKRHHRSRFLHTFSCIVVLTAGFLILLALLPWKTYSQGSDYAALQQSWQHANQYGTFHYATTIVQTTRPLNTLGNVGLSSKVDRSYIEGDVNRADETMHMHLWTADGNIVSTQGVELRVEDGKTYGRIGGSDWQETEHIADIFAPGGDHLSYLVAARKVQHQGTEQRVGMQFTTYTYTIDGPTFADYMRQQMEDYLHEHGKLPPDISLDTADVYTGMTGEGEVWVNEQGLPVRQIVSLVFPEDDVQQVQVSAVLTTDFSQWNDQQPPLIAALGVLQRNAKQMQQGALSLGMLVLVMGSMLFVATHSQSRKLYLGISTAVIVSMLVAPLMRSQHMVAFAAEQTQAQRESEQQQQELRALDQFRAQSLPTDFTPHTLHADGLSASVVDSPGPVLHANSDKTETVDSDSDGLADDIEADYGTDPQKQDSDGDGLHDGVEALQLGTNPTTDDSDGDGISDAVEISVVLKDSNGTPIALNPTKTDTNGDTRMDGSECPGLVGASHTDIATLSSLCPDTDGDGTPDAFDLDNDNDGVTDMIDSAPDRAIGGGRGQVGPNRVLGKPHPSDMPIQGFKNQTFDFTLEGMGRNQPFFVDFQVRPVNPDHLWYTMNVLDWPTYDREGNVMRVKDTTFGASGKDANGDMRLMPYLEIEIPYQNGYVANLLPVKQGITSINKNMKLEDWLDKTTTTSYGLIVKTKDASNNLLVYVPLGLVNDPVANTPVALAGRMFYPFQGDRGFGDSHTVRLAWVVNALQDQCTKPPGKDDTAGTTFFDALKTSKGGSWKFASKTWNTLADSDRAELWCQDTNNWQTTSGPIHTYYDDWYLTAFEVTEDHGVDAAVVYEDLDSLSPSPAPTSYYEGRLLTLAERLGRTFMAGRKDDPLTVETIKARFDNSTNTVISDTARWNLPKESFKVHTVSFAMQPELAYMTAGTYKDANGNDTDGTIGTILKTDFSTNNQPKQGITDVNILVVREERQRRVSASTIDDVGKSAGGVVTTNRLTMSFAGVNEITLGGMQLFTYHFDAATQKWQTANPKDYWTTWLQPHIEAERNDPAKAVLKTTAEEQPYLESGMSFVVQSYFLALQGGLTRNITEPSTAPNDVFLSTSLAIDSSKASFDQIGQLMLLDESNIDFSLPDSDDSDDSDPVADLVGQSKNFVSFASDDISDLATRIGEAFASRNVADGIRAQEVTAFSQFIKNKKNASAVPDVDIDSLIGARTQKVSSYANGVKFATTTGLLLIQSLDAAGIEILSPEATSWVQTSTSAAFAAVDLYTAYKTVKDLRAAQKTIANAQNIAKAAKLTTTGAKTTEDIARASTKANKGAAYVGLALDISVAVGLFAYTWASGQIDFGTVAFKRAVADMIAQIIVAVILLVIALIPVIGQLIVAVIAAIDALVALICKITGGDESSSTFVKDWVCAGLTGIATKVIAVLLYSYQPVVDLQKVGRLNPTNPQIKLLDVHKGFQRDNSIQVSLDTITRLYPADMQVGWAGLISLFVSKKSTMKQSTFKYWLVQKKDDDDKLKDRVSRGGHGHSWTYKDNDDWYFEDTLPVKTTLTLQPTGINTVLPLYLSEASATWALECVTIPIVGPVCWPTTEKSVVHTDLKQLVVFDIFPPTLAQFYDLAMADNQGSVRLAWDVGFPTLKDADGDGLRSKATGGNDPIDASADTDNDGISDYQEISQGSNPIKRDSDGDGLTDYEEAYYKTNPNNADTDGDGLTDLHEIEGWAYVYGRADGKLLTMWVTSDPVQPDKDQDGVRDADEKVYGFNPNVTSAANVLSLSANVIEQEADRRDGFVRPGQALTYDATVENELLSRYAKGVLAVQAPPVVQLQPEQQSTTFSLLPRVYVNDASRSTASLAGSMTVSPMASTQAISVSFAAGAELIGLPLSDVLPMTDDEPDHASTIDQPAFYDAMGERGLFNPDCVKGECRTSATVTTHNLDADKSLKNTFTQVFWVQSLTGTVTLFPPRTSVSPPLTSSDADKVTRGRRGIVGYDGSLDKQTAFPSVFLVDGRHIQAGFGTGNAWQDVVFYEALPGGDDITWHHVALSYDGMAYTLYVDGEFLTTKPISAALTPPRTNAGEFSIGRATAFAHVRDQNLKVIDEIDDGWAGNSFEVEARLTSALTPSETIVWDHGDLDDGETHEHDVQYIYKDNAKLELWETDNGPDDYINKIEFTTQGVDVWALQHADALTDTVHFDHRFPGQGGEVEVSFAHTRYSYELHNALDEMYFFDRALGPDEIALLHRTGPLAEFRFDEPVQTNRFADSSAYGNQGTCDDATCPASGVVGRSGQAVSFTGSSFIDVEGLKALVEDEDHSMTAAAWVYLPDTSSDQKIMGNLDTATNRGFVLGVQNGAVQAGLGVHSDQQQNDLVTLSGGSIQPNTWTHLALKAFQSSQTDAFGATTTSLTLTLFVDGERVKEDVIAGSAVISSSLALRFGAAPWDGNGLRLAAGSMLDNVQFFNMPLTDNQLLMQKNRVPSVRMPFDESPGATSFTDSVGNREATCRGSACPAVAHIGKVGNTLIFDGDDDVLSIPAHDDFNLGKSTDDAMSIGMWVYPTAPTGEWQDLIVKEAGEFRQRNYSLALHPDDLRVHFKAQDSSCSNDTWREVGSTAKLTPEQWNHIVVTYDGRRVQLYINGAADAGANFDQTGLCQNASPVLIGRTFMGRMDELFMTKGAAWSPSDVQDLYRYQLAWYHVSVHSDLTIDTTPPSVELDMTAGYLPSGSRVMAIQATDNESGIQTVEYSIDGTTWTAADQDNQAWVFTYVPTSAGQQTVFVRATDWVGNTTQPASKTFAIDGTSPTVDLSTGNLVSTASNVNAIVEHDGISMVQLQGRVADDSAQVAHVVVTLLDVNGNIITPPTYAILDTHAITWNVSLPLFSTPNGAYVVQMDVTDGSGNQTRATKTILLDGTAPWADIAVSTEVQRNALAGTGETRPTISGTVHDLAYPTNPTLLLHMEASMPYADSATNHLIGTCIGQCPSSTSGKWGSGLQFAGSQALALPMTADNVSLSQHDFTAMAWVKLDGAGNGTIIGTTDGMQLGISNAQIYWNDAQGGGTLGTTPLQPNVWTHLAWRFEQSTRTRTLFVNGVATASAPVVASYNGNGTLRIGHAADTQQDYLQGTLDDVLIYNRVLTDDDIRTIASVTSLGVEKLELVLIHTKDGNAPSATTTWQDIPLNAAGQPFTTWSYQLPEGYEGPYSIALRATETGGRVFEQAGVWQGDIDTRRPRVSFNVTPVVGKSVVSCQAEDYNLTTAGFGCPLPASDWYPTYQTASWYTAIFPQDTRRLARLNTASRLIDNTAPTIKVCDAYNNCTSCASSGCPATLAEVSLAATGTSLILSPVNQVLTMPQPVQIEGYAQADGSLKDLTVTVNDKVIYTQNWSLGAATSANWSTTYTPTAKTVYQTDEGVYHMQATVTDWNNTVITDTTRPLFYVDSLTPTVSLTTTRLTLNNLGMYAFLTLSGNVAETVHIVRMQARVDIGSQQGTWIDIPNPQAIGTHGYVGQWHAAVPVDIHGVSDGQSVTVWVRVTDIANRTTESSAALPVDITAPQQGTITLSYQTATGATRQIDANATISDVRTPNLTIAWSAASDSAGIARYLAGWSLNPTPDAATLTAYPATASSHTQQVGDVQRLYAHLIAEDSNGNQQISTIGPVYVDYEQTPAYISMDEGDNEPYHGWFDASCNLLGTDYRIARQATALTALSDLQQLYTTWDSTQLRMSWVGANWQVDGDLFIYLDTREGGSTRAYNPYTATMTNTIVTLPPQEQTLLSPSQSGNQTIDAMIANRLATMSDVASQVRNLSSSGGNTGDVTQKPMGADYLIWVQEKIEPVTRTVQITDTGGVVRTEIVTDTSTNGATLLQWDDTNAIWQPASGTWSYHFNASQVATPTTDIAIPFTTLGITDPASASLALVAIAVEEEGLDIWATMPSRNGVTSNLVTAQAPGATGKISMLINSYDWSSLRAGICPRGTHTTSDIRAMKANNDAALTQPGAVQPLQANESYVVASISADPNGIGYSFLEHGILEMVSDVSLFSSWVDWNALTRELCEHIPNEPMCARHTGSDTSQQIAFNPNAELYALMAVDEPPVGNGDSVTYTISLANAGNKPATGLVVEAVTLGPVRLRASEGAEQHQDDRGEYSMLAATQGTLVAGEVYSYTFHGTIDTSLDKDNITDWAIVAVSVYDDSGSVLVNQADWLYLGQQVDQQPPEKPIITTPRGVLGPGTNTIGGFVHDASAVPNLTLEIESDGQTKNVACTDATPLDHEWLCTVDVGTANEDDTVVIRVKATDRFGNTSEWREKSYRVDATPASVAFDDATSALFEQVMVGPASSTIRGKVYDNRAVQAVEICDTLATDTSCQVVPVSMDPTTEEQALFTREDVPEHPLAVGKDQACSGGSRVERTFEITQTFTIDQMQVGVVLEHPFRSNIDMTLKAPWGDEKRLLQNGTGLANYNILIDDTATKSLADDYASHGVDTPFYAYERRAAESLADFAGKEANGIWTLSFCDTFADKGDGAYIRSQLTFLAATLPTTSTGSWEYALPLPPVPNRSVQQTAQAMPNEQASIQDARPMQDGNLVYLPFVSKGLPYGSMGMHMLTVYGIDGVGNRTDPPLEAWYAPDVITPTITLPASASVPMVFSAEDMIPWNVIPSATNPAGTVVAKDTPFELAGLVSDDDQVESMDIMIVMPDGTWQLDTVPLEYGQFEFIGSMRKWAYTNTRLLRGVAEYEAFILATDRAGNSSIAGPVRVQVKP